MDRVGVVAPRREEVRFAREESVFDVSDPESVVSLEVPFGQITQLPNLDRFVDLERLDLRLNRVEIESLLELFRAKIRQGCRQLVVLVPQDYYLENQERLSALVGEATGEGRTINHRLMGASEPYGAISLTRQ